VKAPDFWWQRPPALPALLLRPFGALYGAMTLARMRRPGRRAEVPVLCIGNVTAGGAGKTPTALAVAEALLAAGERPVFLTRGYRGSLAGPALVLPAHTAADVGDEPLLLARLAPTVIARDRVAGAALAASHGSVIIMDDGLQNPALAKDFSIAVFDGGVGTGNGLCLPAGPLRAPAEGQARQVDALLVVGLGIGITDAMAIASAAGKPVHRTDFSVDPAIAERIGGARVLAFAGIGRPQKFFETLLGLYARIEGAHAFADHHAYTDREAADLLAAAKARNLLPVTTEKDMVRLRGSLEKEALAAAALALPVRLILPPPLVAAALAAINARRSSG
jgi:tetraacyldisaccharide 4'-kinase